jgi:hypothetical protein
MMNILVSFGGFGVLCLEDELTWTGSILLKILDGML